MEGSGHPVPFLSFQFILWLVVIPPLCRLRWSVLLLLLRLIIFSPTCCICRDLLLSLLRRLSSFLSVVFVDTLLFLQHVALSSYSVVPYISDYSKLFRRRLIGQLDFLFPSCIITQPWRCCIIYFISFRVIIMYLLLFYHRANVSSRFLSLLLDRSKRVHHSSSISSF